jgi:hypothetical protein
MQLPGFLSGITPTQLLVAVITGIIAFVIIEIFRSLMTPVKPIVAEYRPRMVSWHAVLLLLMLM